MLIRYIAYKWHVYEYSTNPAKVLCTWLISCSWDCLTSYSHSSYPFHWTPGMSSSSFYLPVQNLPSFGESVSCLAGSLCPESQPVHCLLEHSCPLIQCFWAAQIQWHKTLHWTHCLMLLLPRNGDIGYHTIYQNIRPLHRLVKKLTWNSLKRRATLRTVINEQSESKAVTKT